MADKGQSKQPVTRLRALNSYMAFRSYYNTIFSFAQQKTTSVLVTKLWKHENNKNAWVLIAKAYSAVRDFQGKEISPLDKFLEIVTPDVGVIKPSDYLNAYGWIMDIAEDGEIALQQIHAAPSIPPTIAGKTVMDIIRKSVAQDYVSSSILTFFTHGVMVAPSPKDMAGEPNIPNQYIELPSHEQKQFQESGSVTEFYSDKSEFYWQQLEEIDNIFNCYNIFLPPRDTNYLNSLSLPTRDWIWNGTLH